jgi:hypothetical protein
MRRRGPGFIAFVTGLLAAVVPALAENTIKVTVTALKGDGQPVRTITSAPDLAAFDEHWAGRVRQRRDPTNRAHNPQYRINIQTDRRSESWFYEPAGLVRVLSVMRVPVYRLPSAAAFNTLLGIKPE